ncbi:CG0192 family protein [Corynebacterium alimapuense]|uniref:Maltokinase N-terminal cap domain-containing protein n=1 Tax=Corynebacterium alimapuense TaxID=1576874 RepID=A0A3M8K6R9_9CORY|nr:hypothetical protein [Corynebacterium alimapuense]RNE48208.1 hypothetical protein C5L39_10100 [Corynebacterium alimapuense]
MSGIVQIYDAELNPTKEWIAASSGGVVTLLGSYRLADPAGKVGIEVLVGSDIDGRPVQLPLTYRAAELHSEHTLSEMEHSVLGRRWVSNALGDPVAVAAFIRVILEGDDAATRSDGVPAALVIRGSGDHSQVSVTEVELKEATRQRAIGTVVVDGQRKSFQLYLPHSLHRLHSSDSEADPIRHNLIGWLPSMPEKQRVVAELSLED